MGGLTFANFLFPNTLYTSPINFQWGMVAIISLKPSSLKASKGRREIDNTDPFFLFQSPIILFDGLVSRGGGVRKLAISEKLTSFIFLCFCGNDPLDIFCCATWRETQDPLLTTYYFSVFCTFVFIIYMSLKFFHGLHKHFLSITLKVTAFYIFVIFNYFLYFLRHSFH